MIEENVYDVFLSHNSDDKPLVEELALRLQDAAGINPWLDAWHIPGGAEWEAEIERALGSCKTCAVILGEHGWGDYHLRESKAALTRHEKHPSFRVIPVFLPGAREEDTDVLPDFFAGTQWIDFRERLDDADALARLVAAIRGEVPYPEGRPNLSYTSRRDARRWEESRRQDDSLLYRGNELRLAQQWTSQYPEEVAPLVWEFLQASLELQERERATRERQQQRIILGLATGLTVALFLTLLACVLAGLTGVQWQRAERETDYRATAQAQAEEQRVEAEHQRDEAQRQQQIALARQLSAQSEAIRNTQWGSWTTSALLAVESMHRYHQIEAVQSLQQVFGYLGPVIAQMRQKSDEVADIAFSPDGRLLAAVNRDGTARVWEVTTGRQVVSLGGNEFEIEHAAFGPDGQLLALGCSDGAARIWDVIIDQEIATLRGHEKTVSAQFSPNGQLVLTIGSYPDSTVRVWNTATWQETAQLPHEGPVSFASFSPNGLWVATASDSSTSPGEVRIWEVISGREIARLEHEWEVHFAVFDPSGDHVMTISGPIVRVWDWRQEQELSKADFAYYVVHQAAFSPDGESVAFGEGCITASSCATGSYEVFLWKWKTNEVISRQELPYAIGHVAFSPDGAWLLTESGVLGWESTIIQIWSPLTGLEAARLEGYVAAFSPDGKKVAVAKDNTVVIWEWNRKLLEAISPVADVLNGSSIFSLAGLTFSLDGQWVATVGENTVQVWEMTTGREIARIAPEDLHTVEFSPGKEWLVTGGWDITQVWETTTWQEVVRREGEASPIIFSRNGRWIAAVGNNGHEVQVWETATGQDVAHVTSNDLVSAIEFSPDGHLLAIGSWDHTARVWDVEMGQEVARMAHEASVETVAFSPNGQWVASGGADGVRVWETATGQEVGKLEYKDVNALAFSPDGQRMIVTSMRKNLAWLLDTRTWQEVAQMSHMGPAIFEGFTPDSQWILTRDDVVPYSNVPTGRTARIWSAITGQEQIRFESQDLMRAASFILNSPWLFTKDDLGAHIWFWRHEDLITEACARLPRNLTPGEWRQYIGDETYRPTCPNQLVPGD